VLHSYGRIKTERIEEISRKFQGLKGEYQTVHLRLEAVVRWRYRVRLTEKLFYIFLLAVGFLAYKSPSLLNFLLVEHIVSTIVTLGLSIVSFTLAGWYLEKRSRSNEHLVKKLKEKMKDAKRMLVSQMDPTLVEAVKEIVKADMKDDLERLRNSDEGCSQKCKLLLAMHKLDV
jgi:hypothetical protein